MLRVKNRVSFEKPEDDLLKCVRDISQSGYRAAKYAVNASCSGCGFSRDGAGVVMLMRVR